MYCKNCGQQIDDNAEVCVSCGYVTREQVPPVVQKQTEYCCFCGREIAPEAAFCVHCGKILPRKQSFSAAGRPKQPGKVFGILGIIFSALSLVVIGITLSIIGMTRALSSKNQISTKINIAAICVSVAVCLILLFVPGVYSITVY